MKIFTGPRITEGISTESFLQVFRFSLLFLSAILHNLMHKNNGKEDYVKCMKEMAGIQWERHALHIWQEEDREAVAL